MGGLSGGSHQGREVAPINIWERPGDGYNRAAEQIADTLRGRLNIKPRPQQAPANLRTTPQDPVGHLWVKADEHFRIDLNSDETDKTVADTEDSRLRQARLATMAGHVRDAVTRADPYGSTGSLIPEIAAILDLLLDKADQLWKRVGVHQEHVGWLGGMAISLRGKIAIRDNQLVLPMRWSRTLRDWRSKPLSFCAASRL